MQAPSSTVAWVVFFIACLHLPGVFLSSGKRQVVHLDLRQGIVKGYSPYITFISKPRPSSTKKCDSQAVIRVDFSGPFQVARFVLHYDRPRLWTVDVSDSPTGDGYGGDNGTTSNMAEAHIFNRQMRIYGNKLPGYLDASIDGGLLLKVVDDVINEKDKVTIEVSDERIEWTVGDRKDLIQSKFLYTLTGQNVTYGEKDDYVFAGFNRVVAGSFRAGSGLCNVAVNLLKPDERVDMCKSEKHNCHPNADCLSTRKSYRCRCKFGFYGNGKICVDENECEFQNGGCVHYCANTEGSYSCSCMKGFQLAKDGHNCIDRNECFVNKGGCAHQCVNTLGSYECRCNNGYSLSSDGRTCIARRYCQDRLGCAHHCQTSGRPDKCVCRTGYILQANEKDCARSCAVGNGGCQHNCTDSLQGPVCSCHVEYMLTADKHTCIATCRVNNGGCDRRCEDTERGPKCSCPEGYLLHRDKKTCLDLDECATDNGGCSHTCENTHGSFECICPKGYKLSQDQRTCEDEDECKLQGTCDHVCVNTAGSYHCHCLPGYDKYGLTHCADRNECSVNNGGCQHQCTNTGGGFRCTCRDGYKLHPNKKDCVEIGSCSTLAPPPKASLQCSTSNREMTCRLHCQRQTHTMVEAGTHTLKCGPSTGFLWPHEKDNMTLLPCSEMVAAPAYKRQAKFLFSVGKCRVEGNAEEQFLENLIRTLRGDHKFSCIDGCQVNRVKLQCGGSRKGKRGNINKRGGETVTVLFELEIGAQSVTDKCDLKCAKVKTRRQMKRTVKALRKSIKQGSFFVRFDGLNYPVSKNVFKASRARKICQPGHVLVKENCVACSVGMFFNVRTGACAPCQPGTYQDKEGQVSCTICPHLKEGVGLEGATKVQDCAEQCEPGYYSATGLKPCRYCQRGTYQREYGRTHCDPCGRLITTRKIAATGFEDCLVKPEKCRPGQYYDHTAHSCASCPKNTYQAEYGQDFCVECPNGTNTDTVGATNGSFCKDRRCGGRIGKKQGFIQSPNWPGPYPADVECVWKIVPEKGRRILVVIPEIFLYSKDKCQDKLVMRKAASPYSLTTYETCGSTETPIAFSSRSRKLWIQFKSDGENSAKGFSIPYVTYDEEYQNLIEDIVKDGKLYGAYTHQQVLKDQKLISALLEVIGEPYNYFKYADVYHSMFPASFIKLLKNKVLRFFTEA